VWADHRGYGESYINKDDLDEIQEDKYGYSETEESKFSIALESVVDIIDRFYRIATKVRNPATRLASPKVSRFKQIDEDTGVDIIEVYLQTDLKHIREIFRSFQGDSHQKEDHFLIPRLAKSNRRRRQQFSHWKRHREKLAHEMSILAHSMTARASSKQSKPLRTPDFSSSLSQKKTQTSRSLPTTATILDITKVNLEYAQSAVSLSSYAPSIREANDEMVDIPLPPKPLQGAKYFECPYCFTLCSNKYLEEKAWRCVKNSLPLYTYSPDVKGPYIARPSALYLHL
jgi:hypothetical protein